MARRTKIAVSISGEVLELLERHAAGRSRSRAVEEELLSALRCREWERLASQLSPDEADELLQSAAGSFAAVDEQLTRTEASSAAGRRRRRS